MKKDQTLSKVWFYHGTSPEKCIEEFRNSL